jgi:hypothetical protein
MATASTAGPRRLRTFLLGLGVRLLGVFLIWWGDGSDTLFRKTVVVAGVVLSIGGIALLRYLLIAGLRIRPRSAGSARKVR